MKISYDCEELIEELKEDINEFGDFEVYAFFEKVAGIEFITNYDFVDEDMPLSAEELNADTIVLKMTAKELLERLEEQNRII